MIILLFLTQEKKKVVKPAQKNLTFKTTKMNIISEKKTSYIIEMLEKEIVARV